MTPEEAVDFIGPFARRKAAEMLPAPYREDAVQEALLAVWRAAKRLDGTRDPKPFLYVVARQALAMEARKVYARKEWEEPSVGLSVAGDVTAPGADNAGTLVRDEVAEALTRGSLEASVDPSEEAERSEIVRRVREALEVLTPIERAVIEGVYLRGLSCYDVAREMGRNPSNGFANQAKIRGLKRLRPLLADLVEVAA